MIYNIIRTRDQPKNSSSVKEGDAVWFTTVWSEEMNDRSFLIGKVIVQKKRYRIYLRNNRLKILDEDNKEITDDPELIREICRIAFKSLI